MENPEEIECQLCDFIYIKCKQICSKRKRISGCLGGEGGIESAGDNLEE